MSHEERTRCTDDLYCSTLDERIHGQEGKYIKGFLTATVILFSSGDLFQEPAFYRDHSGAPPIYLNFCPFCGYDFGEKLRRYEEAKRVARERHEASGARNFVPPSSRKVKRLRDTEKA